VTSGEHSALSTSEVHKRYRDGDRTIEAVAGVSIDIERGTFVALRGPSGSGKTTLLGILGGMIAPSSGSVRVLGEDVTHLRDHHRAALRRTKLGFVFQELSLIAGMTVLENVTLALVPSGGASKAQRAQAEKLLARVGLADRASSKPVRLSGGERQRVAIARAMLLAPPVLLLDEPTAHLDTENAQAVTALLGELKEEGTTIVAATHDPRLAGDARVDRVITMRDGRLAD
jgi:putative ABC transport system ATP-binding protein